MHRREFLKSLTTAATCAIPGVKSLRNPAWGRLPSLEEAVSNNAVAAIKDKVYRKSGLYSFLGIGESLAQHGIHTKAFRLMAGNAHWERIKDVPGPGRLAATAQTAGNRIFILGGYSVQPDGREISEKIVTIYNPVSEDYEMGPAIPRPVDDSLSVLWRNRYLYLISGWSHLGRSTPHGGNLREVQCLDVKSKTWMPASPIPARPTFGHSGGLLGNRIVCVDGVIVTESGGYRLVNQVYSGDIDETDPRVIHWNIQPSHPGPPAYRAAAGTIDGRHLYLIGGTSTPYNYDAKRYDGKGLAQPLAGTRVLDSRSMRWSEGPDKPAPTMDHRAAVTLGFGMGGLAVIGGIGADGRVSSDVEVLTWEK